MAQPGVRAGRGQAARPDARETAQAAQAAGSPRTALKEGA
jgi:hypothetical protein